MNLRSMGWLPALALAAACGGEPGASAGWSGTVEDSAGVQIVRNPSEAVWSADEAWGFEEVVLGRAHPRARQPGAAREGVLARRLVRANDRQGRLRSGRVRAGGRDADGGSGRHGDRPGRRQPARQHPPPRPGRAHELSAAVRGRDSDAVAGLGGGHAGGAAASPQPAQPGGRTTGRSSTPWRRPPVARRSRSAGACRSFTSSPRSPPGLCSTTARSASA